METLGCQTYPAVQPMDLLWRRQQQQQQMMVMMMLHDQ
jgi:hypothetical protein